MKRIFTLVSLISAFVSASFAQGEMNAFNLSYNDLTGTARSVGMGGAFGALGGDVSGVAINPAGIGVYKTSEIVTTMSFANTKTNSEWRGLETKDSKFKFMFDNLAFVGAFPINSDEVPYFNFGVSYNKLKSFDRKINARSGSQGQSMTNYLAQRANNAKNFDNIAGNGSWNNTDWLSLMSYDSGLIEENPDGTKTFVPGFGDKANSNLYMREKGEISSYDLNLGTTISDIVSIGATVAVTDIDYHLFSDYEDIFGNGDNYFLTNNLKTEGTGWQVKAGVILKPVNELRIGVAYHSPTWYNMTDYTYGTIDANAEIFETPTDDVYDYKFRTPDKWVFSLAGIIGQYAIISADYELTNYNNMKFDNRYDRDYDFAYENEDIKADFKNSSTLRVGAEIRFTPQFSGRLGYMWQQSPVKDDLKKGSEAGDYTAAIPETSTVPHYSIVGDANHFTWGLGYRFTPNFYTDVAFVIKTRTDDLYAFGGSDKIELKTNQFTGLLTLGYKF